MDIKEFVIALLWVLFLVRVYYAIRTGRIAQAPTKQLGLTFFLALIAFSFWGEATEQQFDHLFARTCRHSVRAVQHGGISHLAATACFRVAVSGYRRTGFCGTHLCAVEPHS